jgi:hypothetical protein
MADRLNVVPELLHAASAEWDGLRATLNQHQVPQVGPSWGWGSAAAVAAVHASASVANQLLSTRIGGTAWATRDAATAFVEQEVSSADIVKSVVDLA